MLTSSEIENTLRDWHQEWAQILNEGLYWRVIDVNGNHFRYMRLNDEIVYMDAADKDGVPLW